MKKVIVVLLLLAMIGGGLFAQNAPALTVQGRIDTYFVPFQYIDRDGVGSLMATGMGRDTAGADTDPATGINGTRARLFLEGKGDNVGLKIQLQFYPTGPSPQLAFDDNVMVWWKPFPQLELDAGKYVNDIFRGKIGDNWIRKYGVGCYNNDAIFTRFNSAGVDIGGSGNLGFLAILDLGDFKAGLQLPQLKPFVNSPAGNVLSGNGVGGGGAGQNRDYEAVSFVNGEGEFAHVWSRIQIAAGYNIQDIGFFRAQFVGANPSITGAGTAAQVVRAPRIEAAFQLTAVKGLNLDFGFKFPLPQDESQLNKTWAPYALTGDSLEWVKGSVGAGTYKAPMQIALGVGYVLDDLTINGRVDANFAGGADVDAVGVVPAYTLKQGFELNVHLWPVYNLGFMKVGLDLGFAMKADSTVEATGLPKATIVGGNMFGAGFWAEKSIGACTVKGGLAFAAPTKVGEDSLEKAVKSDTIFSIPVVFDFTF